MFFKRLAVVGVVALAAANAASARELQGDKHSGEAALTSEAGKPEKAVGVVKSVLKAEGTVMDEAKAKEEKLKQKKWKVKSIPPLKKVRALFFFFSWKGCWRTREPAVAGAESEGGGGERGVRDGHEKAFSFFLFCSFFN